MAAATRKAAAAKAAPEAQSGSHARVESLLPSTKSAHDTNPEILLLGAGILLALVLASGSLVAVANRVLKGQVR